MSISTEITRLQTAKANIKTAIEAKGGSVPSGAKLDAYPSAIESIPSGGGDENRLNLLITNQLTALTASDLSGATTVKTSLCEGNTNLRSVTLPNTITTIGTNSFKMTSISAITIPSGVTNIGSGSFEGTKLSGKLTIPGSDVVIGEGTFRNCTGLTSIDFQQTYNLNFAGKEAFIRCNNVSAITFNENLQNGYFSEGGIFRDCTGITEPVVLPVGFKTIGYRYSYSGAFANCYNIPSYTFMGNISDIAGYSSSQEGIFENNTACTYFDFTRNYTVPTLAHTRHFQGCPANYEIRVPEILYNEWTGATNWSNASIVGHIVAYPNPYSPVSITYTTTNASILSPNRAYSDSRWNALLTDNTTYGTVTFYGSLTIPDKAYTNNSYVETITIPEGVKIIEDTLDWSYNGAFKNCTNLKSIVLPTTLTSLGRNAFDGCSSLTSITLSDTSITEIKTGTFSNCSGLTNVTIPEGVTKIGGTAFSRCSNLNSIDIPSTIESFGDDVFYYAGTTGYSMTCRATTPPTISSSSLGSNVHRIYVPASSVNAYKTSPNWIGYASVIYPIE